MHFDTSTPRVNVTIKGTSVAVPAPFVAGHTCSENEASALNQLLRENVRNNLATRESLDQAAVDEYVAQYEFGARRSGGGAPALSPVERKARAIAKEKIQAALKARGQTVEKENLAQMVEQLAARSDIIKLAEAQIKAVEKLALEDLDGLVPQAESQIAA